MATVYDENTSGAPKSGFSRRSLIQRSVATAAVAAPLGLLVACGTSSTGSATSTAPTTSTSFASLKQLSDNKAAFTEIMTDETSHVTFLMQALGTKARPKPTFQKLEQPDIMTFAQTSQALENTGVGAYLLAAPLIANKQYLGAAGGILTIEARHAGFIDVLLGNPISANGAFDKPLTLDQIVQAASPFIASLNGGGDPSKPPANDVDILNFALLLEFLEADFYTTNVPKFFP